MTMDITRRDLLTGSAALAGLVASPGAALAAIPSWMQLRIEAHRDAYKALERASKEFGIHEGALRGSLHRGTDPEYQAAWNAVRLACERNDVAFRTLLAERPRTMAENALRARYLAEECRDEINGHEDFVGLFLGSMAGREG